MMTPDQKKKYIIIAFVVLVLIYLIWKYRSSLRKNVIIDSFRNLDMDEIIPNLYLGSLHAGINKEKLKQQHFKKVINLSYVDYPKDEAIEYLTINVYDSPSADIQQYFRECCAFIDDGLQRNEKVLVHCYAGISRSTSVVVAYLMWKKNITSDQALEYVRKKREIANPNLGFMRQLKEFEEIK